MIRIPTLIALLAVACPSCIDRPLLVIQIQRAAHIEADALSNPFTVEVLDASGQQIGDQAVSPGLLMERQRVFEGMNLTEGERYRVRLTAPLPAICPGPKGRLLGLSPPFTYTRQMSELNIYVDCEDGSSSTPNKPQKARYLSTTTFLPDPAPYGQVLIIGGAEVSSFSWENPKDTKIIETIETYDPRAGLFRELTTPLSNPLLMHQATAINEAQLLITGGLQIVETANSGREFMVSNQVRLIDGDQDPILKSELRTPRTFHTAAQLSNGNLFLAGGGGYLLLNMLLPAEQYDPTGVTASQALPSLAVGRFAPAVVPFSDGRQVLVAGGTFNKDADIPVELYCLSGQCGCGQAPCITRLPGFGEDPGRTLVTGTLVPCDSGDSGAIYLLGGGRDNADKSGYLMEREIYCLDTANPAQLEPVGQLNRERTAHTTTLVGSSEANYRLLVAGGAVSKNEALKTAEIFPVSCRCDQITTDPMAEIALIDYRVNHTATSLADGTILIYDGMSGDAERVNPSR